MMKRLAYLVLAASLGFGCSAKKKTDTDTGEQGAGKAVEGPPKKAAPADAGTGTSGHHRAQNDWVPAEYKKGRGKWKETGVYVDGKPMGMLKHGELPIGMTPSWAGDDQPGDPATQRFQIYEYLVKVGVNPKKIKEVHLYGGGLHVIPIKGRDFIKHRKRFTFRFGQGRAGKTLLHLPPHDEWKSNTLFDKLSGVAVYINKKPPTLNDKERPMLDGKRVYQVPYFGEPIRGGVRVYKDDVLVLHIKRNKLEESEEIAEWTDDKKELRWKLMPFLTKYGVDTSDVVEASIIRDEERFERMSKADLDGSYFIALPQSSGMIELNGKTRVQALALYTKPLPKEKLAQEAKTPSP